MHRRFLTLDRAYRAAVVLCGVVFLVGMAGVAWAVYERFHDDARVRAENARAWHSVVCYLEAQIEASPAPPERKAQARIVYAHILDIVGAKPCPGRR